MAICIPKTWARWGSTNRLKCAQTNGRGQNLGSGRYPYPVKPALHYICVTAQADAGRNGLHNLRMPFSQIDKAIEMAKPINALVFWILQVGFSTVQTELPKLEKYLRCPTYILVSTRNFMKEGSVPGKRIGTFDADDINYVTEYFSGLVNKVQPAAQNFCGTPFYQTDGYQL
jgi:hypothetical protein